MKADEPKAEGGDAGSPMEKINVGELSCRARNPTNVGLD